MCDCVWFYFLCVCVCFIRLSGNCLLISCESLPIQIGATPISWPAGRRLHQGTSNWNAEPKTHSKGVQSSSCIVARVTHQSAVRGSRPFNNVESEAIGKHFRPRLPTTSGGQMESFECVCFSRSCDGGLLSVQRQLDNSWIISDQRFRFQGLLSRNWS